MSNDTENYLRLIANPYRLRENVRPSPECKDSFEDNISGLLNSEFRDIYVNTCLIDRIKQVIRKEVNEYIIETIVSELVSTVTEQSIRDVLQDNESRNLK